MFKNNITHLTLTIDRKGFMTLSPPVDLGERLLSRIFHTFTNLIELDFNQNNIDDRSLISVYGLYSMFCYSKSLVNLSISVNTFDGRFSQLRKLCVLIRQIDTPSLSINVFIKK